MKKILNLLIGTGVVLSVFYVVAVTALVILDEEVYEFDKSLMLVKNGGIHFYTKDKVRVYDLPDHKVLIMDGELHLYKKVITFNYLTEEQMEELAE